MTRSLPASRTGRSLAFAPHSKRSRPLRRLRQITWISTFWSTRAFWPEGPASKSESADEEHATPAPLHRGFGRSHGPRFGGGHRPWPADGDRERAEYGRRDRPPPSAAARPDRDGQAG